MSLLFDVDRPWPSLVYLCLVHFFLHVLLFDSLELSPKFLTDMGVLFFFFEQRVTPLGGLVTIFYNSFLLFLLNDPA